MGLLSFKNFVLVSTVAFSINMYITGPEQVLKRIVAMYEKPELTLYPLKCVFGNCISVTAKCMMNSNCRNTLDCITECTSNEKLDRVAACAYTCEMTHGYENQEFLDLIRCFVKNECLIQYPDDGKCYGTDADGVKFLTSLDQIKGDWWVTRGLNCGQDGFPGGYDGYPCQHERFTRQASGQWINTVTYCDGKEDNCISDMIETIANVSLPAPGVVQHDYTDAPLSPQVEKWRIVSWPNQGDFLFMLWCGRLPILNYNGGIVLSRQRNDKKMPKSTLDEFKRIADKHGFKWDEMCPNNNDNCST